MAFFRTVSFAEPLPTIEGTEVFLRAPQMSDYSEWATLREASRAFLTPWEPTWPADDLGRSAFRRRLRRYAEDQRADSSYAFFLFRKSDHALVGGLTLANIRRGVAQAGSLGYWTGEPFARRGLMTGAVSALVPFAFSSLCLHPDECRLDPAAGALGLSARGLCARISLYQRDVAGPFAVCPTERRADGIAAPGCMARPWVHCLGLAKVRLL
jgi:ribosomal-protein-alanine N-acetyltransferase